jgi:hypothetical protein
LAASRPSIQESGPLAAHEKTERADDAETFGHRDAPSLEIVAQKQIGPQLMAETDRCGLSGVEDSRELLRQRGRGRRPDVDP